MSRCNLVLTQSSAAATLSGSSVELMSLRASRVMKVSTQPHSCSSSSRLSGNTISGSEGRVSSWPYLDSWSWWYYLKNVIKRSYSYLTKPWYLCTIPSIYYNKHPPTHSADISNLRITAIFSTFLTPWPQYVALHNQEPPWTGLKLISTSSRSPGHLQHCNSIR